MDLDKIIEEEYKFRKRKINSNTEKIISAFSTSGLFLGGILSYAFWRDIFYLPIGIFYGLFIGSALGYFTGLNYERNALKRLEKEIKEKYKK